jgi:p-aminobenzoyl-glutamate transporter AbgT
MIQTAVTFFAMSIGVFTLMLIVVHYERRHSKRLLGTRLRGWLDKMLSSLETSLAQRWSHFVRYIVQLNWYYSIHSVLKTILLAIQVFYTSFEKIFERNRSRAKKLRMEKRQLSAANHLSQMADHKVDTALTPAQKKKLRHKKLEEKH